MPGHTAIHDCLDMYRAMEAEGIQPKTPAAEAFQKGWEAKDKLAQHWGKLYTEQRDSEERGLRAEIAQLTAHALLHRRL